MLMCSMLSSRSAFDPIYGALAPMLFTIMASTHRPLTCVACYRHSFYLPFAVMGVIMGNLSKLASRPWPIGSNFSTEASKHHSIIASWNNDGGQWCGD